MNTEDQVLTYGQKLIGVNPELITDDVILKVKIAFADLVDIVNNRWCEEAASEKSPIENELYHHAIGEIISAQMAAVKMLTYKRGL